jgi:hypothetical protein
MITSRESFDAFVSAAWSFFSLPRVDELSGSYNLNDLYEYAAEYNPQNVFPKDKLAGTELYSTMATFVQATIPKSIAMQGDEDWPDLTGEAQALVTYYNAKAAQQGPVPIPHAEALVTRYLHVYPVVQANANWRIGLNVTPADMGTAMAVLVPLLDEYDCIDHMKFLAPGNASKADSVIIYADRQGARFDEMKHAAVEAVRPLRLQPRVGAMWEEIHPGIGEASEPPEEAAGTSFTTYRCIVTYLAYWSYAQSGQGRRFDQFRHYLGAVMEIFGLDPAVPFAQGPLRSGHEDFLLWWRAFQELQQVWQ